MNTSIGEPLVKLPEQGFTNSRPGLKQHVWLIITSDEIAPGTVEGCEQIPPDRTVIASVRVASFDALFDAAGNAWECQQADLTDAGAVLFCMLLDHCGGGRGIVFTLTDAGQLQPSIN